jgi:hypothetical protein
MLLLVVAVGAAADPTLEPERPGLGERALLELDAAPADSTDWPVGMNVAVRPTEDPSRFELMALRVGEVGVVLPATGDTIRWEVPVSIAEPSPELLRPLHGVGEIAPRWGWTLVLVVLVLALVLATILYWRSRRRSDDQPEPVPLEPPEVVARRELDRLERDGLLEGGRFEEFYIRGSHVLREYAGRRFELPILDLTTSEAVERLASTGGADDTSRVMEPLLSAADEVKFARHEPETADGVDWLGRARNFVEETTRAARAAAEAQAATEVQS